MMKTPIAIITGYVLVIMYGLQTTIYEHVPDPRVENWLLMRRWTPIILIISGYYLVVMIGPILMESRKPYTLRNVLKVYNFVQVCISFYMFKEFVISAWQANYSLRCQLMDPSNSPQALRMAGACWWFFFSKVIDLLDTFFFILRKKNSQVTFLHVYHHGSMILNWWLAAKYFPGGQNYGYKSGRPVTLKFSPSPPNPLAPSKTLEIPVFSGRSASAPASTETEWPAKR